MKDQVEDLTRLGLRALAIGLGDEKGEKTFARLSIFISFRWRGSPVGDRTAVSRLELVVGVVHVHWSGESTSFSKGSLQRRVITVQK